VSKVRLAHLTSESLAPFAAGLCALEADIRYPAGDQTFTIDHGPAYHPFFSAMGAAHFVVASAGSQVVGNVVGVCKQVQLDSRSVSALYICDLKVAAAQRGAGLARRMLTFGLWRLLRTPELRGVRLLYGAAMKGARGDVTRSARGASPLKLARPWARSWIYFAAPAALAALEPGGCPASTPPGGIDLSRAVPTGPPGITSTAGRKDLRLLPDGISWPLLHLPLGPHAWHPSFGHYLRACGEALVARGAAGPACFALDQRLAAHNDWLARAGVSPGAACTIHGLDLTGAVRRAPFLHLATSEI
jgi:hypothetical protein